MYRFLARPPWIIGSLVVAAIVASCIRLGFWQLERHQDRIITNAVISNRLESAPLPITDLLEGADIDLESLEFRQATAQGVYLEPEEVLVRSQVHNGTAGYWVVTPLRLEDGRILLVNRGWIPMEPLPNPDAAAPDGKVGVSGLVRLSQQRPAIGPTEPAGRLEIVARIDIERLAEQLPGEPVDVWLQALAPTDELPIPLDKPTVDSGPHLSYALQWFGFAGIGLVGYFFLVRRSARPR